MVKLYAKAGDFVYLDPPYLQLNTSKARQYTPRTIGSELYEQLHDLCKWLNDGGVKWMLSNNDHPLIKKIFADYRIESAYVQR